MKKRNKLILGSVMSIAMCASLIAGSTYALFSSESTTSIAITSGKVEVKASVTELWTSSDAVNEVPIGDITDWTPGVTGVDELTGSFATGGSAVYTAAEGEGSLTLSNIAPGDAVKFTLSVANESSISIKYQIRMLKTDDGYVGEGTDSTDKTLSSALEVKLGEVEKKGLVYAASDWSEVIGAEETIPTTDVIIRLPKDAGNEYQSKSCKISLTVLAVQGNAKETSYCDEVGRHEYVDDVCIYCGAESPIKGHYAIEEYDGSEKCVVTIDDTMSGDLVIPSTVNGVPVVVNRVATDQELDGTASQWRNALNRAKDANKNLKLHSLVIEEGVDVGALAFYTSTIEHLVLKGNANYGRYAFGGVKNLVDVKVYGDVTLETYVFNGSDIQSIDMSEATIESLPLGAFESCEKLTEVKLPNGLTSIGHACFTSCDLRELILPATVTEILTHAFSYNKNLDLIVFQSKIDPAKLGASEPGGAPSPKSVFLYSGTREQKFCFTGSEEEWPEFADKTTDTGFAKQVDDASYVQYIYDYSLEG